MNGKNDSKSKNNYIVMLSNRKQKNHYNFGKTITNAGEFTTDSMSVTIIIVRVSNLCERVRIDGNLLSNL